MARTSRIDSADAVGARAGDIEASEQELARRKAFLEIGEEDVANLTGINDLAQRYADEVIEDFYRHLLAFEETRAFFGDPQLLQRVKGQQKEYFLRLTQGNYDLAYMQNRVNIGTIHEHIGLPVKSYLGMYNFYLRAVSSRLTEAFQKQPKHAWSAFLSLMKLTFLDIGLAIDTYIVSRERTIREQQAAIRDLPTPVLPFREGLLLVPIIGILDGQRARQLTEQLLNSIRSNRAKVVVIDITGVQSVDSRVANHIVQTVEAARLMGARVIIAGVSPEIAQTMVTLGIDLGRIATVGDLQSGIEQAEQLLGYAVTKSGQKAIITG
ncbi:MAG TPA: protoglobin domain-containing protein [Stellaceae bacterium]|nr:protoglobin domain-containing protein [Stellaceae bacterium]